MATFHFDPNAKLIRLLATVHGAMVKRIVLAVDTGASTTVVSRDVAFSLGIDLAVAPISSATTASRQEAALPLITIPRLDALDHSRSNVEALCLDLPPRLHVDGVLGLNFLRHFKLFINFPKGIFVLQERTPRHVFHRLAQLVEVVKAHW